MLNFKRWGVLATLCAVVLACTATGRRARSDASDPDDATGPGGDSVTEMTGPDVGTSSDGTDGSGDTDGTTSTDGTGVDGGSTDFTDFTDSTDGSDGTDFTGSTDGSDATDSADGVACELWGGTQCYQGECCTCSGPPCDAGIDNELASMASLANGALADAVGDGDLNLLLVVEGSLESSFELQIVGAELSPNDADCDITSESCAWQVDPASYDDSCNPTNVLHDGQSTGSSLLAGGPGSSFALLLPLQGVSLTLRATPARLEASYDGWTLTGVIGGAISKKALMATVDALPPEGLPIDKGVIKDILENIIMVDIDALNADGEPGPDGVLESASVGVTFTAIPAQVVGVASAAPGDPCPTPPPVSSSQVFRIVQLQLGTSALSGMGLDVDGICYAPAGGYCE